MRNQAADISSQRTVAAEGRMPRILIAAGGTGGHVFPAIAIADALREVAQQAEFLFVGTKDHMEWQAVPKAGYDITSIWISGFHRRLTIKNLMFPVKLITSLVQSLRIIQRFKPDVVVSCGGYVAGPVGWVAQQRGIPLVIQEQNSFPGVTNRLLGKKADTVFTAFKEAKKFFPAAQVSLTGNPVRRSLGTVNRKQAYSQMELNPGKQTLLVLGGSGGARSINEAMVEHIYSLHDELGLQIIWQCGTRYYQKLRDKLQLDALPNLQLVDFLQEMPEAYAVADLVISRAGALSCTELAITGTPSILVPSPNVAGDHQAKNAKSMVAKGAAALVADGELKVKLVNLVKDLICDRQRLKEMSQAARAMARPDAGNKIAKGILEVIN